ncbi:MAG: Ig-like domain-containing protein [Fibrobacterota bacterium]|nr:Ig-like domain-containing protein [Fibrobacterota bacterium]
MMSNWNLLLPILIAMAAPSFPSGLPQQTYKAGELLSSWKDGGRLSTYHNGLFYMIGMHKSFVWDISNPKSPVLKKEGAGFNGHRWAKFGNAFWKEYELSDAIPTGYNFLDLSALPELAPYKGSAKIPLQGDQPTLNSLWTYPHREGGTGLIDVRTGASVGAIRPSGLKTVNAGNTLRIGNLWFFCPGDNQTGVAVVDVGNPANPKILAELKGDYKQYTTTYQVWRHYLILIIGDDTNVGGNNLIAIDFRNPTDLKVAWSYPTSLIKGMRYMMFKDEFGFGGRGDEGLKINLETGQVVQRYKVTDYFASDFQWIPLGHLLVQTASENCVSCGSQTHIFALQDSLDNRPPKVDYHLPKDGALNQPLGTVVGLVIAETLDDVTINDKTVLVRPVGGAPVTADVVSYSYNVVNIAPRSPLLPNTTYEVEVVGGGIKDVAGNGIVSKKFYFSTGSTLNAPLGSPFTAGEKAAGGLLRREIRGTTLTLRSGLPGPWRASFADMRGKVHTLLPAVSGAISVPVGGWARGLHTVILTSEKGRVIREKVLIP